MPDFRLGGFDNEIYGEVSHRACFIALRLFGYECFIELWRKIEYYKANGIEVTTCADRLDCYVMAHIETIDGTYESGVCLWSLLKDRLRRHKQRAVYAKRRAL